ncbi:MAG: ribonuclease P protein component [Polyangiaceae bacterium]
MAFGFGPERRLRRHSEFVRAQRTGRRVGTAHFTLLVSSRAQRQDPARLGLVVARKIGNAVRRNRVKRLCRECFRTWPDLLPKGVDLVVIARQGADKLSLAEVQSEWLGVRALLQRRAMEALAHGEKANHPPTSGSHRN